MKSLQELLGKVMDDRDRFQLAALRLRERERVNKKNADTDSAKTDNRTDLHTACCICLGEDLTHGFLHKGSVHVVCCVECAGEFKTGDQCPVCNQRVEQVVKMHFAA